MLKVINVVKRYKDFSLKSINFEVSNDEYFVILGPSGSGKSTLLECIAGIRSIDEGTIYLDGLDITDLPPEKRNISIVFQEDYLFPHMNVFENIEYGLRLRKIPREERRKKVLEIARRFRIADKLEKFPSKLSGGEKQRASLARALIVNPKLLLLDEPLNSIDAPLRKDLREELRLIKDEYNIPFIHVTHDQIEAITLADKIAILIDGRIVEIGEPKQIFSNPKNVETARFIGFDNIFKAKIIESKEGTSIAEINGDVKLAILGNYSCLLYTSPSPRDRG